MTVTLDLPPTEEARLAEHLPSVDAKNDSTLALFAQWSAEDAAMTAEEADEESQLWQRFESNVNETRQAQKMRRL